ncbi:MAG: ATP-binding protein [Phycisphaerae bacterium]|nr:ATP-binding protein [Phycisphaerae bacterium]
MPGSDESVVLKNDLAEIGRLADVVAAFGARNGLPERDVHAIHLALEEVVTNVISYGYEDDERHDISVSLCVEGDGIVLEVRDDGRAFDPTRVPDPDVERPLAERPIGGLGLFLVRKSMDSVEYRRERDENVLSMTRSLGVS